MENQQNNIENEDSIREMAINNNENAIEIVESNEDIPILEVFHMADEAPLHEESPEPIEPPYELINYQTAYHRARGSYTQTFRLVKIPLMYTELNPSGPEYEEQGCLYGCYKSSNNKILSTDALTIMKSPLNDEKTVHLNYCSHTNQHVPIIKPERNASKEFIYTETRHLPKRKNLDEMANNANKRKRTN